MMYLLDAGVLLGLRTARVGPEGGLGGWAVASPVLNLFVSAMTLLELEAQAARSRDRAAGAAVKTWLDRQVAAAFDGRILPVDAAVARRAAQLPLPDLTDALVAATALEHALTLATLRTAAFRPSRAKLLDPTRYRPQATADEDIDWREAARTGPLWLKNLFVRT